MICFDIADHSPTYHRLLLPSHLLPCPHTSMVISLPFPPHNGYLAFSVSAYNLLVSRMTSHFRWARPTTYMANHLGKFRCLALIGKLPLVLMLRHGKQVCGGNSIAFKPAVPGAKVTSPEVYEPSLLVGSTT